jgi:hypothetical protein
LLSSKNDDEVLGTIASLTPPICSRPGAGGAEDGVHAVLKLIWGTESDKVWKVLTETAERNDVAKTESPTKPMRYPNVASNLVKPSQGELFNCFDIRRTAHFVTYIFFDIIDISNSPAELNLWLREKLLIVFVISSMVRL